MCRLLCSTLGLLILLFTEKLSAQEDDTLKFNSPSFGVNAMYGFFMANQPKAYFIRQEHSKLFEVNVSRQTDGRHAWHHMSNFPRTGIAALYGSVGSPQYIGNILAVYPYIHFPLIRSSRVETSFRLGAGLGWVEKPYDKEKNFKNLMTGTHLNAAISLKFQTELSLSHHISLNGGIQFTHLSNGSVRLPNLGLNIPAVSIGVRYYEKETRIRPKRKSPDYSTDLRYTVHLAGALKQSYPLESSPGLVRLTQIEVMKNYRQSRFGGGLLISKDNSLSHELANTGTYLFDKSSSQWQVGLFIAWHYRVGRLSIPIQLGTYLFNKYQISPVFQHIGIRYHIDNHWVAGIHLKTHFGNADYIQYGIGYEF